MQYSFHVQDSKWANNVHRAISKRENSMVGGYTSLFSSIYTLWSLSKLGPAGLWKISISQLPSGCTEWESSWGNPTWLVDVLWNLGQTDPWLCWLQAAFHIAVLWKLCATEIWIFLIHVLCPDSELGNDKIKTLQPSNNAVKEKKIVA